MRREKCLACSSNRLIKIMDLGNHAFADTFVPLDKKSDPLVTYNLSCELCPSCGNVQSSCETDPVDRYSLFEYSYTSSNSRTSMRHWDDFSLDVSSKLGLTRDSFVVEVGSNDGYLLGRFRENLGTKILGIDASSYVSKIAIDNGIETEVAIFDSNISKKILKKHKKADLVVANNVFNHSENPVDFACAAADILSSDGTFVFEVPYWKCSVESEKIDQVYHEHVTYMTVKSAKQILKSAGLVIEDVEVVDYHGGSLRVYAKKKPFQEQESVQHMIDDEESLGLFESNTYEKLMKKLHKRKFRFLRKIYDIKSSDIPILAVGAAAKGNTFLRFLNLDHNVVDYVTDASKHKQGKITPLTNISICGDEVFANYDEVYALILSWNISGKIKEKLYEINPNIKFLVFDEF